MGELLERIKLSNLVYGNSIADNFKNNSLFFYDSYTKSDKLVMNIPKGKIQMGGFYFFHYLDDSNWMKYSPIFTVDVKKFSNLIIAAARFTIYEPGDTWLGALMKILAGGTALEIDLDSGPTVPPPSRDFSDLLTPFLHFLKLEIVQEM